MCQYSKNEAKVISTSWCDVDECQKEEENKVTHATFVGSLVFANNLFVQENADSVATNFTSKPIATNENKRNIKSDGSQYKGEKNKSAESIVIKIVIKFVRTNTTVKVVISKKKKKGCRSWF